MDNDSESTWAMIVGGHALHEPFLVGSDMVPYFRWLCFGLFGITAISCFSFRQFGACRGVSHRTQSLPTPPQRPSATGGRGRGGCRRLHPPAPGQRREIVRHRGRGYVCELLLCLPVIVVYECVPPSTSPCAGAISVAGAAMTVEVVVSGVRRGDGAA